MLISRLLNTVNYRTKGLSSMNTAIKTQYDDVISLSDIILACKRHMKLMISVIILFAALGTILIFLRPQKIEIKQVIQPAGYTQNATWHSLQDLKNLIEHLNLVLFPLSQQHNKKINLRADLNSNAIVFSAKNITKKNIPKVMQLFQSNYNALKTEQDHFVASQKTFLKQLLTLQETELHFRPHPHCGEETTAPKLPWVSMRRISA